MGRPRKDVDTEGLYKILGVAKTASFAEIKKAFHKMAKVHHPDRGGDKEKFQEIQEAWEVLGDKDKRETYDKHGMDGLKDGGVHTGMDISDLFGFGGGRGRQQ